MAYGWFPSKTAAQRFCKDLLAAVELRAGADLDRFDRMRLLTILDAGRERGYQTPGDYPAVAIDRFTLAHITCGGEDFYFLRAHFVDGSSKGFSPKRLFSPNLDREKAIEALRTNVRYQSHTWRKQNPQCHLCGRPGEEVDHYDPPFQQLALDWLARHGLDWDTLPLRPIKTVIGPLKKIGDKDLAADWKDYHRANATLRTVCRQCHPRRGVPGYGKED